MWIYYLFFIILIIAGLTTEKRASKVASAVVVVSLWLLIGLRDSSVGADTWSYLTEFHSFSRMDARSMWQMAVTYKEPLYVIISWLISVVSMSDTFYLLIWALFPAISLFLTFRRYLSCGSEYIISIIVFFILGLYAFYVAGIRQTAALSIALLSIKYIDEKKLVKFIICILIAMMIHSSALLFVIAYPLRYIKIRWWFVFFAIGAFIVANVIQLDSLFMISQYFFGERFENYAGTYESTQNSSAFLIQLILFLLCIMKIVPLTKKDELNNTLFALVFIGLIFQSLANMMAEMSRISFYFCIFYLILVPRALSLFANNRLTKPISVLFVAVCLVYLFVLTSSNLPEYHFASFLRLYQ